MEKLWAIVLFSLLLSSVSAWLAVVSARRSARAVSTASSTQVAQLRQELTEVLDLIEQIQKTLKKRSARNANAARWDGEPDPVADPEAWKKWANAGGLRQYLKR